MDDPTFSDFDLGNAPNLTILVTSLALMSDAVVRTSSGSTFHFFTLESNEEHICRVSHKK